MIPVKGLFVESDCVGTVESLHSIAFSQTVQNQRFFIHNYNRGKQQILIVRILGPGTFIFLFTLKLMIVA